MTVLAMVDWETDPLAAAPKSTWQAGKDNNIKMSKRDFIITNASIGHNIDQENASFLNQQ